MKREEIYGSPVDSKNYYGIDRYFGGYIIPPIWLVELPSLTMEELIKGKELWHFIYAVNYKIDMTQCKNKTKEVDFWQLPKLKKKKKYEEVYEDTKNVGFEEFSLKEIMSFEKEYYGFYIFAHPLKDKKYKAYEPHQPH